MATLTLADLQVYRWQTFHQFQPIQKRDEAVAYANERGFIYFWPISGVLCPSLWVAVAGDRPVPNEHDDPGHISWGWKDQLLGARQWHYAKVLRGKATIISLEVLPYFYALHQNSGEPEQDYQEQYVAGLLTREAKRIYETVLQEGTIDTIRLRRQTGLANKSSQAAFDRALVALQRDFKVLPVGVAEAGAWRYSHLYAFVHHWYPELPALARSISRTVAQQKLVEIYFRSVGWATADHLRQLFQWKPVEIEKLLADLVSAGILQPHITLEGQKATGYALPQLRTL